MIAITKRVLTGLIVMVALSGCKKFLEQLPDNRAQLNSPQTVSQLLGTAYPQASYAGVAESMSDNVDDKGAGGIERFNQDGYLFQDVDDDQQDSPEYYWDACYAAIAAANQALAAIEQAPDKQLYQSQKGEALVARAYAHFMLVTLFSKFYDAATAASDLGIPYVLEPETVVFKDYERRTVAYVYEMIEKDLLEGLPLIDDTRYDVPKYHFTKSAANSFASRFYLYKRDYQKVVQYANAVFGAGDVVSFLRPWNTVYQFETYLVLFANYAKATEAANLLLAETQSLWGRSYYTTRYGLNSRKRDEILEDNVTGGTWSFNFQLYTAGTNNYLIPKINEFFQRESVNAQFGLPYVMLPLFTAEEVLFNRAEANAYLSNSAGALSDLNTYASTRISNYDPAVHSVTESKIQSFYGTSDLQSGLVATVLDFKRAEFVQEGMRWFDILRYKIPVTHETFEGQVLELGANDPRRVWQIPQSASLSGVEQNPR